MVIAVLQVRSVTGTNCKSYSKHVLLRFLPPLLLANSPFIHSVQYVLLELRLSPLLSPLRPFYWDPAKKFSISTLRLLRDTCSFF